jgi:uncharacterized protein YbjT (DUF2867 family)
MYVVLGATGNTGSVVAEKLLAAGKKVRVYGRSAEKLAGWATKGAEVAIGDVEDAAALGKAFAGAEGVYLLLPPDPTSTAFVARGRRIAEAYVTALEAAKVPHAVLLSSVGAELEAGTGPIVTVGHAERRLAAVKGTVFTFVRAAYFMENVAMNLGAMKDGVLPTFSDPTPRFDMVATRDIGATAAAALLSPPTKTEVVELSGPAEVSIDAAAKAFGAALGRDVKSHRAPIDAMVPTLTGFGFSTDVAGLYREMTEAFGAGRVHFTGVGRRVRGETSIGAFAKSVTR